MKVIGLDGREYKWNLSMFKPKEKVSKPHKRAREFLYSKYPCVQIYEEVTLPGSKTATRRQPLTGDFFIPQLRLMVEVHGRQHYEHIQFFNETKQSFAKAQHRDRQKKEWCEGNEFIMLELPAHETDEEWEERLNNVWD